MRKTVLLLLTIFLMSGEWSVATTIVTPATNLGDSLRPNAAGFSRRTTKFVQTSSGDLLCAYQRVTSLKFDIVKSTDGGTSWTEDTNIMNVPNSVGGENLGGYGFGDTSFWTSTNEIAASALRIALYGTAQTRTALDSQILSTAQINSGNRAAILPLGSGKIFGLTYFENSTADSTVAFTSDGAFSEAATYTREETSPTVSGFGLKVPATWTGGINGGILYFDQSAQDLFWCDTLSGLNTALHTSFLNFTGNSYQTWWMWQMKDSLFMIVWQNSITAGTDSLRWKRFRITGTATGSPAVTSVDSGLIEGAAGIRSGDRADITGSQIWGTDSAVVYYKYWSDTTIDFGYDIAYRFWNGSSWGAMTTYIDVAVEDTIAAMQAPQKIYVIGGNVKMALAYVDSAATRDSLRFALNDLPVTVGGTQVQSVWKKTTIKKVSMFFDILDIWRPDHEVF